MKAVGILKWFLYTSIFAALCAVGLCMATEKLLLGHFPPLLSVLHIFIIANTLIIYNIHYFIKKIPPGVSDRADWTAKHKGIHPTLIATGTALSLYCLFFLNIEVIAISVGLGILSLAYSLPILPFKQKKRLKDWGTLKLFLLAFVWSCVTVLMPMFFWGKHFTDYEVEFLMRFCFMVPLCAAFDIRDMEIDKSQHIHTLPNVFGVRKSYWLMDIFLLLFCLSAVWQFSRYPHLERLLSALLIAGLTKLVLLFSKGRHSDIYYLLLVDGMMLVYALSIWLVS